MAVSADATLTEEPHLKVSLLGIPFAPCIILAIAVIVALPTIIFLTPPESVRHCEDWLLSIIWLSGDPVGPELVALVLALSRNSAWRHVVISTRLEDVSRRRSSVNREECGTATWRPPSSRSCVFTARGIHDDDILASHAVPSCHMWRAERSSTFLLTLLACGRVARVAASILSAEPVVGRAGTLFRATALWVCSWVAVHPVLP
jgi:hypothetical protein